MIAASEDKRGLTEVGGKKSDHPLDLGPHTFEDWHYLLQMERLPGLVERYGQRELALLLSAGIKRQSSGVLIGGVVGAWFPLGHNFDADDLGLYLSEPVDVDYQCVNLLVTVEITEPVENPKGLLFRSLPSLERLLIFDDPTVLLLESADCGLQPPPISLRSLRIDRKSRLLGWPVRRSVEEGELPREVIERRAQVVDVVADQEAQFERRFGGVEQLSHLLAGLKVRLLGDSPRLRFHEVSGLTLDQPEMFVCPIDLSANAV